jgi:hypothetical protein
MHIFDIATMKCLQTLDTAPNTNGVMAFSTDEVSFLEKKIAPIALKLCQLKSLHQIKYNGIL